MELSFYLVQGGQRACRVAAQAVASLNRGDDALEVSAVEQLGELQKTMAQDEELANTREAWIDATVWKIPLQQLKNSSRSN